MKRSLIDHLINIFACGHFEIEYLRHQALKITDTTTGILTKFL